MNCRGCEYNYNNTMATTVTDNNNTCNCPNCGKKCNYKDCEAKRVHTLYNYCEKHMQHQEPLTGIEKPDACPICFEEDSSDNLIQLTCGHYLHKECMIQCGRPTCPICRQFVYMTKDVFLRLRIRNLIWKMDHMPIDLDDDISDAVYSLLNGFERELKKDESETMLNVMDKILCKFNQVILGWYHS